MMISRDTLVVFLTGAGVSAESGLRTFRATDGLWENHPIEEVATPEAFQDQPDRVHNFYNHRRRELGTAQPNLAHKTLGELEKKLGDGFLLITQNIDDLHERGGSQRIIHMHGELYKIFCIHCGKRARCKSDLWISTSCSSCGKQDVLRPDIVWFGEMPYRMEEINDALARCTLFAAIGTSGNVFPAAGFVLQARTAGAITCEINMEPSAVRQYFDYGYYGLASEQLPLFVKDLEAGKLSLNP